MPDKLTHPIKILYLYDYKDWAIHNVGKLWFGNAKGIKVKYLQYKKMRKSDFDRYHFIWYGYSDLFLYHYSHLNISSPNLSKCITAIHDPQELFPQISTWKKYNISLKCFWNISNIFRYFKLTILKQCNYVITTSKEMQIILNNYGIRPFLLPTMSNLPIYSSKLLKTDKCSIISIFENYPRKNLPLMYLLRKYCIENLKVIFDTKIGKNLLSLNSYCKLLDNHEIYICTSFQEGGPLPAMDAMRRGMVVITTPVGQIQEFIIQGKNGFICNTEKEFMHKVNLLTNNLKLLHKMRLNSLKYILKNRNKIKIQQEALGIVDKILLSRTGSDDTHQIYNYNFYRMLFFAFFLLLCNNVLRSLNTLKIFIKNV